MEDCSSKKISEEQAMTCAVEFLISGYVTTASVLSHVSYMLALHTEVQERVQAEIDKCFKKKPVSGYVIMYTATQNMYIGTHVTCVYVGALFCRINHSTKLVCSYHTWTRSLRRLQGSTHQ